MATKYRISEGIRALTPWRAKLRNALIVTSFISGLCIGATALYSYQYTIIDWVYYETSYELEVPMLWVIALVAFAMTIPPFYILSGVMLAKHKKVVITPGSIRFRKWGRIRELDRTLPSRFVLREHDRAAAEKDSHAHLQEKARIKGKARKPRKYYQKSYILSLEHVGLTHDIIAIYGERKAKNALARLNASISQMDGAARSGKGVSITPQDEWHDAAGGLPKSTRY